MDKQWLRDDPDGVYESEHLFNPNKSRQVDHLEKYERSEFPDEPLGYQGVLPLERRILFDTDYETWSGMADSQLPPKHALLSDRVFYEVWRFISNRNLTATARRNYYARWPTDFDAINLRVNRSRPSRGKPAKTSSGQYEVVDGYYVLFGKKGLEAGANPNQPSKNDNLNSLAAKILKDEAVAKAQQASAAK